MNDKKILFEVTHPKHFHQFKNLAIKLKDNNEILFLARDKDVVISLLENSAFSYVVYNDYGKTLSSKFKIIPRILIKYFKIFKKFKPDVILSRSSPYSTFLSKFFPSKTIIFPDSEVVKLTKYIVAPLADFIISPSNYQIDYGKKHFRLEGLFEETYLSSFYFKPEQNVLNKLALKAQEKFFLVRFVSWNANHDINQYGFNLEQKRKLIRSLEKFGKVIISSEAPLEQNFEKYKIAAHPKDIHHLLYYADMYIGDSQSMATEAALLGTPAFRFNSFVGDKDMSNFKLLENKYGLLFNFSEPEALTQKATELLQNDELTSKWKQKRDSYFQNKKDLNQQTLEIISNLIK